MVDLYAPENYLNRELSWLSFNDRVLALATREDIPLLERLKFAAIAASNLDEFYMVRIGGLEDRLKQAPQNFRIGPDGLRLNQVLDQAQQKANEIAEQISHLLSQILFPQLKKAGIEFRSRQNINADLKKELNEYYDREIHPTLTPIAIGPAHPFPILRTGAINLALRLEAEAKSRLLDPPNGTLVAIVQAPNVLDRFKNFPSNKIGYRFVSIEDIIALHANELFLGYKVLEASPFRVTRASDLHLDEEEADDLLVSIQDKIRQRDRAKPVRLEITNNASDALTNLLLDALGLEQRHLRKEPEILGAEALLKAYTKIERPELLDEPFNPTPSVRLRYAPNIFRAISEKDILLHHPYESFEHVVNFVEQAAEDPHVVGIKQTLYRTSGDSPIVRALRKAAEQGKDVCALVELKARFDEAANIAWARALEESGVHVVYGLIGLKTHCKLLLVTRREGDRLKRYLHLGTGNYHPSTARMYTDLGLLTTRDDMTYDVLQLFNVLTGYAELPPMSRIFVAPFNLRQHLLERIEIEINNALAKRPSGIIAKMNSLVDDKVIRALYRASQAGVPIELIVRGICCLRPQVPGLSDNIQVRSILDRFLEHSRIYCWKNGGDDLVYLSSADVMPRNLNRRIEVCFPILDPELKRRILSQIIPSELADNSHSWMLQSDGQYTLNQPPESEHERRTQSEMIQWARQINLAPSTSFQGDHTSIATPVLRVVQAQRKRRKSSCS